MKNQCKLIEIRDYATCIIGIAMKFRSENEHECHMMGSGGYGIFPHSQWDFTFLMSYNGNPQIHYDPMTWHSERTYPVVHQWLKEHFDEIEDGQVIDVRVILGEEKEPVESDFDY